MPMLVGGGSCCEQDDTSVGAWLQERLCAGAAAVCSVMGNARKPHGYTL
ncbi:MAG: hypothetical protein M1321_01335 [Candidatus Marsarchaeota archaeon]|nr:hypothetical protein [Candidatus Marsarchaeota archaeon]